jgi:hypothetical protein
MKKILALLITLTMVLSLCACSNSGTSNQEGADTTRSEEESGGPAADKEELNVTITLPASMYEGETEFDAEAYSKEQGFKETKVNEDGSISITMSKSRHVELMSKMKTDIDQSFAALVKEMPYIESITPEEGFSNIVIEVEKEGYEAAFMDMTILAGLSAMLYQQYEGSQPNCEIVIKDAFNGDILNTVIYPDVLNN